MNKKHWRNLLSVMIAIIMVFSLVPGFSASATDSTELNSYYQQLTDLIQSTWSDDFISSIEFSIDSQELIVDGKTIDIDPSSDAAPFLSEEGRTMLPIGVIIDVLDLDVSFNPQTFDINIVNDDVEIELTVESESIVVNGRRRSLDTPPTIRNGRTYIPVGAVAESLLMDAEWIPEGRRVRLTRPYQTARLIVGTDGRSVSFNNLEGVMQTLRGPDNEYILQFRNEWDAAAAAEELERVSSVQFCEPDLVVSADYRSWGVERISADRYQSYLSSAADLPRITVAVLDTGVDSSHPFLAGRVTNGWNFINNNSNPYDGHGHGTHVAGTIAESTLSNVNIMPVKVLGDNGSGSMAGITAGIRYAADNGADVINMSLGGPGVSQDARNAIQYANSKNTVVVVAAGNDNADAGGYSPAYVPEAITVAANDRNGQRANFSNFGSVLDISAPGVEINSSIPGGRYDTWSGTSMAAPHVAAAVALMKSDSRYSSLNPAAIATTIRTFTDDAGAPGFDIYYGYGILNLTRAGLVVTPPGDPPPGDPPPGETPPSPVTLTENNPSIVINVRAGANGRVPITVTAPSFGSVSVQSTNITSGSDPTLYNASGGVIADNEAGGTHWMYTIPAGQTMTIYGGTSSNEAATYTVMATFPRQGGGDVTLTESNPSAVINVGSGGPGRVPIRVTAPSDRSVSIQSSNITSGSDPSLYNASGGMIADDEAGDRHFRYTIPAGQTMTVYGGTYSNMAATYTVTASFAARGVTLTENSPSASITVGSGVTGRVPITVVAPSNRSVSIQSSNASSGSDPALYSASGTRIADDEAGYPHFRYTIAAGQTVTLYGGTYINDEATYTVTATFGTTGSGVTLTQSNPSAVINVGAGSTGRVPITVTAPSSGSVSIQSSNITSGSDPALYNASGTRIADDEAGYPHFLYVIPAGQTMTVYGGTYSSGAAVYTVTASFTTSGVTLSQSNPSAVINVGSGATGRVPITITAPSNMVVSIQSSSLTAGSDPALYDASGTRIADDEAGGLHYWYSIPAGQTMTVYSGTYANGAARYTVTANFGTAPTGITLSQSNPSAIAVINTGVSGRIPISVTAQSNMIVTLQSSNLTSGYDPALYNATGTRIADDEAGYPHFRYAINVPAGQTVTVYGGTYGNDSAAYTVTATFGAAPTGVNLTQSNPSALISAGSGAVSRIPITVTAPPTSSVILQSSNASSGCDPALYDASGTRIADDEAGYPHFRYTIPAGQTVTVYGGTYSNDAGTYTVTATFGSSSGTTLTPSNPSASVTIGSGAAGRASVTITAPSNRSVTLQSSNASAGCDPALYNASGSRIADDEAGYPNFRYTIPAGQTVTVYCGTYWDDSGTYTVTATF